MQTWFQSFREQIVRILLKLIIVQINYLIFFHDNSIKTRVYAGISGIFLSLTIGLLVRRYFNYKDCNEKKTRKRIKR